MNIGTVVCPVDFSRTSDHALAFASTLAKDAGATLHIIHSYEESFAFDARAGDYVPPPADLDLVKQRLHEQRPTVSDVEARYALVTGEPTQAILDYANRNDADLIVIGTHGRSGVARLLMGSVAENVLRHALCPVLIVRHPQQSDVHGERESQSTVCNDENE